MKTILGIIALGLAWATSAAEAEIERGPHHRVVEAVEHARGEDGNELATTNRIVELTTGMNAWSEAEARWIPADPTIRIVNGEGRVGGTHHKASFSGNINDPRGAVGIVTPDGKRIRIRTVGLIYRDAESGESVLFAPVKNAQGQTDEATTVLYEDAFENIRSDIRMRSMLAGVESDVLIREQLPSPALWGLAPERARLEALHEILEGPEIELERGRIPRRNGDVDEDATLGFGAMRISLGNAFTLPANAVGPEAVPLGPVIPVAKDYFVAEGRVFFAESVPYAECSELIDRHLPARERAAIEPNPIRQTRRQIATSFPKEVRSEGPSAPGNASRERQLAMRSGSTANERPGFVIDWVTLSSASNFTFSGSTTYAVTGAVILTGVTTVMPGAVLKFSPNNVGSIEVQGSFVCNTEPYRPAVVTSRYDALFGEAIAVGSSTSTYANHAFKFNNPSGSATVKNMLIKHANFGLNFLTGTSNVVQNVQFYDCATPINTAGATVYVRNALMHKTRTYAFTGTGGGIIGENITAHDAPALFLGSSGCTLSLTNSILAAVANTSGFTGAFNSTTATAASFTSGNTRGAHYLADNSLRNAGTTNIYGLSEIRSRTTHPPLNRTAAFAVETVLRPHVELDTGAVDLGFHYSAVDYFFGNLSLTAPLILTNGVRVAYHSDKAVTMGAGSKFISEGTPDRPNRIFRYVNVQEQPDSVGSNSRGSIIHLSTQAANEIRMSYTELSHLASGTGHRAVISGFGGTTPTLAPLAMDNTLVKGGTMTLQTLVSGSSIYLTNNAFVDGYVLFRQGQDTQSANYYEPMAVNLYNNLFQEGECVFTYSDPSSTWTIKDNVFNPTTWTRNGTYTLNQASHNAYKSGLFMLGTATNNPTISADFVSGPLGRYYYPASGSLPSLAAIRNIGSRTAASAELYHHTTSADGSKDSSTVDIGFHFPSTDSEGTLADSDADGLADLIEDQTPDGSIAATETSWADFDTDLDGVSDSEEKGNGTDPLDPNSLQKRQLGQWHFRTGSLESDYLKYPIATNGISIYPLITGYSIGFSNAPAKLQYHEFDGDRFNITRQRGSVSLWYNPIWTTSTTTNVFAANNLGQLISLGASTTAKTNWWSLHFSAKGDALVLESEAGGVARVNVTAAISWTSANWYQITLAYETNLVSLYINGTLAGTGTDTALSPSFWARRDGILCFGADEAGQKLCHGTIDGVITWNYALSATEALLAYYGAEAAADDADHDGIPTQQEIAEGTSASNPDSDGDGMPDGWERVYSFDPKNPADSTGDPDWDQIPNWKEYILGLHPREFDRPPAASLMHVALNQTNMVNFDFGASGAMTGFAAAGFSTNDYWNLVTPSWTSNAVKNATGSVITVDSEQAKLSMVSWLGHMGANWSACYNGNSLYSWNNPFGDALSGTNLFNQIACSTMTWLHPWLNSYWGQCYYWAPSTPPYYEAPWRNIVHYNDGTRLVSADMRPAYENSPTAYIWTPPSYGITGSFPNETPGIAQNEMFKSYLDSSMDLIQDQLPIRFGCVQLYFVRDGRSEIHVGKLPGAWYRVYLYASKPDETIPTEITVNGQAVAVPLNGYREARFRRGVNFGSTAVPADDGNIHFLFSQEQSLINGIQLMELTPLPPPTNLVINFSEARGVILRWDPVPSAVGYEVVRTNHVTSEYVVLQPPPSGDQPEGPNTQSFLAQDPQPPRTQNISYFVRAVSEVPEFSGGFAQSGVTNLPALTPNYFHHAPVLTGPIQLEGAFENTIFSIGLTQLLETGAATDADANEITFLVTALQSGRLYMRTNGTTVEITQSLLDTQPVVIDAAARFLWSPPADTVGELIPAFEVAAFDGEFTSSQRALVTVNVKESTTLLWWGFWGDGRAGNGLLNSQGWTVHDYFLRPQPERVWNQEASPVLVDSRFVTNSAPYLTNIVQIAGDYHLRSALRADGTVWTWGTSPDGQIGDGVKNFPPDANPDEPSWFTAETGSAILVSNLRDVRAIAVGPTHSLAVKADGTVWGWGDNDSGALGGAATVPNAGGPYDNRNAISWDDLRYHSPAAPAPAAIPGLANITAVAAGKRSTIALSRSGQVYFLGEAGIDYISYTADIPRQVIESASTPIAKYIPKKVVKIAAGSDHYLALTADGDVYTWGNNLYGSLGVPTLQVDRVTNPIRVPGIGRIANITAKYFHSLAVTTSGEVYSWGSTGISEGGSSATPTRVPGLRDIVSVSTSDFTCFAVDADGRLFGWRGNIFGMLGSPNSGATYNIATDYWTTPREVRTIGRAGTVLSVPYTTFATTPYDAYRLNGLEADSRDAAVDLSWQKYPGAISYEIQRSLSERTESSYQHLSVVAAGGGDERARFTDTQVVNGGTYFYRVRAQVADGFSTWSRAARGEPNVPPGAVIDFTVTALNNAVALKWRRTPRATGYEVYRRAGTTEPFMPLTPVFDGAVMTSSSPSDAYNFVLTTNWTATAGTQYYYQVRATNYSGAGAFSSISGPVQPTSGMAGPTSLVVTPQAGTVVPVQLQWTAPAGGFTGTYLVQVYRMMGGNGVPRLVEERTTTTTSTRITSIGFGLYRFAVSAVSSAGRSNPVTTDWSYTNPNNWAPPVNIQKIVTGGNFLYARWSGQAEEYLVRPLPNTGLECSGTFTSIPDESGTAEFFMTGLSTSVNTFVIEQIFTDYAPSGGMNNSIVITNGTTTALPALEAIASSNRVTLNWWGSTDSAIAANLEAFRNWRFVVQRKEDADTRPLYCPRWETIYDTADPYYREGWTMRIVDTDVLTGHSYRYRVYGISPDFEVSLQTMGSTQVTPIISFPQGTTLNLTATSRNGGVNLAWSSLANASGYRIERAARETEEGAIMGHVASGTTAFEARGIPNGIPYAFSVIATNINEDSFQETIIATASETGQLYPPRGFSASLSANRVFVQWEEDDVVDAYDILQNPSATFVQRVANAAFAVNYSTSSSQYRYLVRATHRNLTADQAITVETIRWTAQSGATSYRIGIVQGGSTVTVGEVEAPQLTYEHVRLGDFATMGTYWITPLVNGVAGTPVAAIARGSGGPADVTIPNGVTLSLLDLSTSSGSPRSIQSPTNLWLRVQITGECAADRVEYYMDGQFLGDSTEEPYEFEWVNPPGGIAGANHTIQARLVDADGSQAWSVDNYVKVFVRPDLSAFSLAATDLQIPAPGVPLELTRSYDSRDGNVYQLGIGWKLGWEASSITVPNLEPGWDYRPSATGLPIVETAAHPIEVSIDGGSDFYLPRMRPRGYYDFDYNDDEERLFQLRIDPIGGALGSVFDPLDPVLMLVQPDNNWVLRFAGSRYIPDNLTYLSAEQSQFAFGKPVTTGETTKYSLLSMADRFGNSISIDTGTANETAVHHSNGRSLLLTKSSGTIRVYDPAELTLPAGSRVPVLMYVVANNLLTEVHAIKDRATQTYDVTRYTYDSSNRLAKVIAPDGVVTLENQYDANGFLIAQKDAIGVETSLDFTDPTGGAVVQVDSNLPGATSMVAFNPGGQIASVYPDASLSTNVTSVVYNEEGLPAFEARPDGSYTSYSYDHGRPSRTVDGLGNTTVTEYSALTGGIAGEIDARGNSTSYATWTGYLDSTNVNEVVNPTGTIAYRADASGLHTYYDYNFRGQILTERQVGPGGTPGMEVRNEYYDNGDLMRRLQLVGYNGSTPLFTTNSYTYDANGNQLQEIRQRHVIVRDGSGVPSNPPVLTLQFVTNKFNYDRRNRPLGSTNAIEEISGTLYGLNGKAEKTTNTLGQVTTHLYDVRGNLLQTTHPDGTVNRTVFDGRGRPTWTQERATPNASDVTTAPATENVYDNLGRITLVLRHENAAIQKVELVGTTDPSSFTPDTFYRKSGGPSNIIHFKMVVTSTGTVASVTRTEYDGMNRARYSVNALGGVTAFEYDLAGRRVAVTSYLSYVLSNIATDTIAPPANATFILTSTGYDPNGNVSWSKDGNGRQTDFVYDAMNQRTRTDFPQVTGESGRKSQSTIYDAFARRVVEMDESGVLTGFDYDVMGRLVTVTNDMKLAYVQNELPIITEYAYDELGSVTNEVRTVYNVNSGGVLTEDTQERRVTWYEYDKLGRRTHRFLPGASLTDSSSNSGMEKTTYGRVGSGPYTQQTLVRDFRNITITSDYDAMGRLASKSLPAVNSGEVLRTITYNYTGPLLTTVQESGTGISRTTYYAYDNSRRLRKKDSPEGVLAYTYHAGGQVASVKGFLRSVVPVNAEVTGYTPSAHVGYTYDPLGRLKDVTNNHSGGGVTTYTYDGAGNVTLTAYPQTSRLHSYFDERNRLTKTEVKKSNGDLVRQYEYALAATGHRQSVTEREPSGGSTVQRRKVTYQYDQPVPFDGITNIPADVYRLSIENIIEGSGSTITGSESFHYDPLGNRRLMDVEQTVNNVSDNLFDFNLKDEIASNQGYSYDANGNVIGSPTSVTDSFDTENRFVKRVVGTKTITMKYDADGHRVSRFVNNNGSYKTVYFLVDNLNPTGYPQVLLESTSSSATPTPGGATFYEAFEWGHKLHSILHTPNSTYYVGLDGHGSVRMLLDGSGNTVSGYDYNYDAYGNVIMNPMTTLDIHYRYANYHWDQELGLYYLNARFYDPKTGRFWQRDSYLGRTEDPATLNLVAYCHGDPVNRFDPSGHYTTRQHWGYSVEDAIQDFYEEDHQGGELPILKSQRVFRIDVPTRWLFPDIFDPNTDKWLEIKPLTRSGVIQGEAKRFLNLMALPGGPDFQWIAPLIVTIGTGESFLCVNVAGIVYYRNEDEVKDNLLQTMIASGTPYAARDLLAAAGRGGLTLPRSGTRSLLARSLVKISLANGADKSRTGVMWGISSLNTAMGGR